MRSTSKSTDYVLLTYFVVLILFGLLVLSSAGVAVGLERFNDPYFFIKRQLFLGFFPGIILFLIAAKIDYHVWKKFALPIFIAGIILLLLPFVPGIGSSNNTGAQSWINVGGFSFQPAWFWTFSGFNRSLRTGAVRFGRFQSIGHWAQSGAQRPGDAGGRRSGGCCGLPGGRAAERPGWVILECLRKRLWIRITI